MPSSLGEWAAGKLFGLSEDEKRQRADEFYKAAKDNPAIGDLPGDQFNSALQQYVKNRSFPTSTVKDVAQPETRYNVGPKYDMTNPDGGVPISVMPQTDVTQKVEPQSFPIQMGHHKDFVAPTSDGSYAIDKSLGNAEDAVVLPNTTFQKSPQYSPDQALAMASGDPKQLAAAFPNGVPGHAFDKFLTYVTAKGNAENARNTREAGSSDKQDKEQNTLEENFRKGLISIRGDASLHRVEDQRDAAITAYGTIDKAEQQGRALNPIEYVDTLGQIYKARTGQAPGEQTMEQMRQQTAKGNLAKVFTYFTGEQAPATTQDIMQSLKAMTIDMGTQADKLHEGYMKQHLLPPSRLARDRADRIIKEGRGLGFQEATGYQPGNGNRGQGADKTGYVVGQSYKMKDGNTATYVGNGEFQ